MYQSGSTYAEPVQYRENGRPVLIPRLYISARLCTWSVIMIKSTQLNPSSLMFSDVIVFNFFVVALAARLTAELFASTVQSETKEHK